VVAPALERTIKVNDLLSWEIFESAGLAAVHAGHNGEKMAFAVIVHLVIGSR